MLFVLLTETDLYCAAPIIHFHRHQQNSTQSSLKELVGKLSTLFPSTNEQVPGEGFTFAVKMNIIQIDSTTQTEMKFASCPIQMTNFKV